MNMQKIVSSFFQSNTTVCLIIHVFCKSCEPKIVFVLICPLAEQFHVHRFYKMLESTMSCIGNFEENINLSHINLAVFTIIRRPLQTTIINMKISRATIKIKILEK